MCTDCGCSITDSAVAHTHEKSEGHDHSHEHQKAHEHL